MSRRRLLQQRAPRPNHRGESTSAGPINIQAVSLASYSRFHFALLPRHTHSRRVTAIDVRLSLRGQTVAEIAAVDDDLTVADVLSALPPCVDASKLRAYVDAETKRQVLAVQRPLRIWRALQEMAEPGGRTRVSVADSGLQRRLTLHLAGWQPSSLS